MTKMKCLPLRLLFSSLIVLFANSASAQRNEYAQTILVANRAEFHPTAFVDKHLVNPWGIALRPPGKGGHIWVSNARNASTSTYVGDVNGIPLHQDGLKIVYMDGPLVSYHDGLLKVTGQVYNAASDVPGQPVEFPISGPAKNLSGAEPVALGKSSGPAKFVFVTTDGTVNAWRSSTAESMDTAIIVKDYSERGEHRMRDQRFLPAYTGVAMTTDAFTKNDAGEPVADNRLYVTDFQNNRIQVFDNQWREITAKVKFERPKGMPEDFSPYNVQVVGGKIYVVYAVVDLGAEEPAFDTPGEGHGHVAVYDRDGTSGRNSATKAASTPRGESRSPRRHSARWAASSSSQILATAPSPHSSPRPAHSWICSATTRASPSA